MTYLKTLAHSIAKQSEHLLVLSLVITLLLAQPLLVRAKPATRGLSQLAGLAQITLTPEEEETDTATEEATKETEPTATVEEPTVEAPAVDQPNLPQATEAATNTLLIEIPTDAPTETVPSDENSYALPFDWQGDATISPQELAEVAPPLQAEVSQGDFQISFVRAEAGATTGDLLRVLPVATDGVLGSIRVGMKLDASSILPPFPADQTILLQLSARVYAPEATTRLTVADDSGSSSVVLDGLNWSDYQVTRQIAADVTSLEVMLEWRNVPANGWLEVRGITIGLLPTTEGGETAALSPTDTPRLIEEVTIAPTAPPPATPTPTAAPLATATPFVTATPVPDSIIASAQSVTTTEVISDALPTPTPTLIIVTSTPTPASIYEEATRVAQATEWARILGPVTPTPPNMVTPTPTLTPIIVTNTPAPANEATATQLAIFATAVAFTTGTPTPIPAEAIILVATQTPIPPTAAPRATATPTPVFVLLDDIPIAEPSVTPMVPPIFYNKILFLTSYRGNPNAPNAMVMNPDGTGVGLLTTNFFYNATAAQDAFSADSRYRVYSLREAGGAAHNAGLVQLFYDDSFYNSTQHQLTYFGAGVAWAPAWSPKSETIAYVSSESGNDEIWVSQREQWPPTQLTKNDWEWDHHPSFSPDGSEIVFSSNRVTGRRQLWVMTSSGGDQRQLTNFAFEAWNPVWVKYVASSSELVGCDPNYAGVCIPLSYDDLDCDDIEIKDFPVKGSDPYDFDRDSDGIGCESDER